jgi:hypothetical protein
VERLKKYPDFLVLDLVFEVLVVQSVLVIQLLPQPLASVLLWYASFWV